MSLHPLTNFEIQKYFHEEPKLNGVYSRNNLSKIKNRKCIISLDGYESIKTDWIALYVNAKNITYFDSFGVENIPKEIRNSLKIKILHQIFIKYKYMMCGYFCIGLIDSMLKGKSFLEYGN